MSTKLLTNNDNFINVHVECGYPLAKDIYKYRIYSSLSDHAIFGFENDMDFETAFTNVDAFVKGF